MKVLAKLLFCVTLLLCTASYAQTATLLPNAEQQFLDGNGQPYANGSVYFYIPTTTSFKTTWQNAAGSVPNTNPVILDAAGRAIIYGIGTYREVLKDSDGNQIWDQLTQDVFSLVTPGQTIWGGTSTGTTNALLLTSTPAITTLQPGQVISFIAGNSNTSSATVNVSGIGVKNILVTTSAGTANIISGNIASGGRYFMLYDGNEFILLNPTTASAGNAFTTIASATTTDLGTSPTTNIIVSGTNTISSFGSSASINNPLFVVQFSGSLQITYNSSTLLTPNSQNLTTQAGDYALMQYLGTGAWRVLSYFPASGYIGVIHPVVFTGAGTYPYTACPNLLYDEVEMVGGGGGSGGSDTNGGTAGGGSGGYLKALLTGSQVGTSQTVTVGAGGTAGAAFGSAGNGGNTTFGSLLTANGGNGSGASAGTSSYQVGGVGGTVTVSTGVSLISITGQQGGMGGAFGLTNGGQSTGGYGGSNPMGYGGQQIFASASATSPQLVGSSGTGFGSGASGSAANGSGQLTGAPGNSGTVVVQEYCLR